MFLSNDERALFSRIVDSHERQTPLEQIVRELNWEQDEFINAVTSLRSQNLIDANPNFTAAWLTKKGLSNAFLVRS